MVAVIRCPNYARPDKIKWWGTPRTPGEGHTAEGWGPTRPWEAWTLETPSDFFSKMFDMILQVESNTLVCTDSYAGWILFLLLYLPRQGLFFLIVLTCLWEELNLAPEKTSVFPQSSWLDSCYTIQVLLVIWTHVVCEEPVLLAQTFLMCLLSFLAWAFEWIFLGCFSN